MKLPLGGVLGGNCVVSDLTMESSIETDCFRGSHRDVTEDDASTNQVARTGTTEQAQSLRLDEGLAGDRAGSRSVKRQACMLTLTKPTTATRKPGGVWHGLDADCRGQVVPRIQSGRGVEYARYTNKFLQPFSFEDSWKYLRKFADVPYRHRSRELFDDVEDPKNTVALEFCLRKTLSGGATMSVLRRVVARRFLANSAW
ncbi:hypothetical protein ON010_g3366 [Phytophthora cinnamomi]|nr:hypothetical protein ON010_g3366 [Phytophthora cinnamomi]